MPQYRVKIKSNTDETDAVTVWAEDSRAAGVQATKIARRLLGHPSFEIVETTDLSPGSYQPRPVRPRTRQKSPHGPVTVKYVQ